MKKLHILIACVLAATMMSCGSGKGQKANANGTGEKYDLCYNLEEGKAYSQKFAMDVNTTVEVMGQSMDIGMKMNMNIEYDIVSVTDDIISATARYSFISMDMSIPMMGNTSYSSEDDSEYDPAVKMLKAMTQSGFTLNMTKYGEVKSIEGLTEMMDNMYSSQNFSAAELAQAKAIMEQSFSEEKMMEQMKNMAIYPDYSVAVGDSWTKQVSTSEMDMSVTYTLEEVADDELVINVDSNIESMKVPDFSGSIKGTQNGAVVAHRSSGWIKESNLKQDISGKGKIQGMDAKMTLKSDITISE